MHPEQIQSALWCLLAVWFSLAVHEMAHAWMARLYGDDTAVRAGRLTLKPWAHFDGLSAIVTVVMALQGMALGWTHPVPVNPANFRAPRRDLALVALTGPLVHGLMALWFGLASSWWIGLPGSWAGLESVLKIFFRANVALGVFHLLPLYPLDGVKIVSALLPASVARHFDFYWIRVGHWPLLGLLAWEWLMPFSGPVSWIVGGALKLTERM